MPAIAPNAEVLAARERRVGAAGAGGVRWELFLDEVIDRVQMSVEQRVRTATEHLRKTIVDNISTPVTKALGPRSGRVVVTERSKPGEFPRADTTLLMKTIFDDVEFVDGGWEGRVGTPLDYGVFLELKMDRSFLVRTLNEEYDEIERILTGPLE